MYASSTSVTAVLLGLSPLSDSSSGWSLKIVLLWGNIGSLEALLESAAALSPTEW